MQQSSTLPIVPEPHLERSWRIVRSLRGDSDASTGPAFSTPLDTGHPFLSQDTWLPLASASLLRLQGTRPARLVDTRRGAGSSAPILFVRTDLLLDAIELLQAFPVPFVLITSCNDDHCPPYLRHPASRDVQARVDAFLGSTPNLKRWFAKNPCHPALEPLPLGPKWQWSTTAFFGEPKAAHWTLFHELGADPCRRFREGLSEKPGLLYLNFRLTTRRPMYHAHRHVREECKAALQRNGFEWSEFADFESYLRALGAHKFCAAPPGRGIDTHRCWEALMLGTIPVVMHTPLDATRALLSRFH